MGNNLRWTREDVAASKVAKDPRNVAALAEALGRKPATIAPQSVLTPKTPQDTPPKAKKRLRQGEKPLMNRLEAMWFAVLSTQNLIYPRPRPQAVRLKIANGAWYKGDIFCVAWPHEDGLVCPTVFECKGPDQMKNIDRGKLTIKVAAHIWPEIRFVLVWKEGNNWNQQVVLP